MDTKKILLAGLAGGVVAFFAGWLIWGMALNGFNAEHFIGPKEAMKPESEMVMWAVVLASLCYGLLNSIVLGHWASISTLVTGAKAGAIIGLLVGANETLMNYSMMNMFDSTSVLVNIIAWAVYGAIVGGVVGLVLGMGKKA